MNRRQILSITTIAAFAAILLTWAPSTAYAGFTIGPADVFRGSPCAVSYINSDGGLGFWEGKTFHHVSANDGAGTGIVTCVAKDVPNNTGSNYVLDITTVPTVGFLCGASGLGFTDIWEVRVSDGGNNDVAKAILVCKFPHS